MKTVLVLLSCEAMTCGSMDYICSHIGINFRSNYILHLLSFIKIQMVF